MPLITRCPQCGKEYKLADEQAGLRVRCRECKKQFEVSRQPELLEAVAPAPRARRPLSVEEEQTINESLKKRQQPASRKWIYITGGLAAVLMVLMLACGGTLMLLVNQSRRAAQMAAAELARAQEEARRERDARDEADRKERAARDEAERQRLAEAEKRIADLERQGKAVVKKPGIDLDKLDLGKLDLNNLEGLLGQLTPEQQERLKGMLAKLRLPLTPVKDLDDALKKLASTRRDDRAAALEFIKVAMSPNDREKRDAVTAALNKIINEDPDEALVESAKTAKFLWENN